MVTRAHVLPNRQKRQSHLGTCIVIFGPRAGGFVKNFRPGPAGGRRRFESGDGFAPGRALFRRRDPEFRRPVPGFRRDVPACSNLVPEVREAVPEPLFTTPIFRKRITISVSYEPECRPNAKIRRRIVREFWSIELESAVGPELDRFFVRIRPLAAARAGD